MAEAKVADLERELAAMKDLLRQFEIKAEETSKELEETKMMAGKAGPKTVIINKERKLSKFSGRKGSDGEISIDDWIEDATYHLRNIPDNEAQVEFLMDHVQGQVRDELRVVPEISKKTPTLIFELLRQLFQDEDTVAQIQQTFYQRSQRKGESLQQYSLLLMKIMERLCKKQKEAVGNKELMLKERFMDGVLDPS